MEQAREAESGADRLFGLDERAGIYRKRLESRERAGDNVSLHKVLYDNAIVDTYVFYAVTRKVESLVHVTYDEVKVTGVLGTLRNMA